MHHCRSQKETTIIQTFLEAGKSGYIYWNTNTCTVPFLEIIYHCFLSFNNYAKGRFHINNLASTHVTQRE